MSGVTAPALTIADPAWVTVGWTVTNEGTGAGLTGTWTDRVIASRNTVVGDSDDVVLGNFEHTTGLARGDSYVRSEMLLMTPRFEGRYHLFVQTDAQRAVFQNGALFDSISVGENVAFPMRRHLPLPDAEIRARAAHLLDQVGLGREYDTSPAALSGGMRKRAGLARAMALEPAILLADEPSAGLDPITASEIDQLLVDLKKRTGTTLIVVTHNIPSARVIGDELVFLHEGRVIAQGDAAALERSDSALVRQFMQSAGAG